MKFTGSFLLALMLTIVSHAAEQKSSRSKEKEEKTDKRALLEGNAGIEKRIAVTPTALPSPSPGIVYADTNQLTDDKSPQQNVYATPQPQLAKISDLLTDHGHHFQAAIQRHLFSPVSLYQTRLPGYEVSAPIPAKLAYTEQLTYQPQTVARFGPQIFNQQQEQANVIRLTYPQPIEQYQQSPLQPQQVNQYQQIQVMPQIQPIQLQQYQQQQPQFIQIQPQQPPVPIFYNQQPLQYQGPAQFLPQQLAQVQLRLPAAGNVQPGIVYTREEENNNRPNQELKSTELQRTQQNIQERPEQNYNIQNQGQGAVSYASFSVGPTLTQPQADNQQTKGIQYQSQPPGHQSQQQYQLQQQQNQVNQQPQQIYFQQAQVQQRHLPVQNQHQYQIQRQPLPQFSLQRVQYQSQQQQPHQQIEPQILQKPESSVLNSVNVNSKPVALSSDKQQLNYYRAEPAYQPQVYQGQGLVIPQQLNPQHQQVVVQPTFPPVQFFGKYAHELFRNYQQQ